jgi:hypothetical protein
VQFTDFTFCQSQEFDSAETELLVEARHVFLVAREAVQRFGYDHVELALSGIL